ncbi:hypothetical protein GCM10010441_15590 [Kitasatospora paracochleata]
MGAVATPVVTESQGTVATVPGARRGASARLRQAASTPPGRLRVAGAALAALVVLFGAVAVEQVSTRATAAGRVVSGSEPLSQDAAEIYRSLADADTTAAAGFLLAADEPAAVRQRYEDDLATASRLLSEAAARTGSSPGAQRPITELNRQLPRYAGLVETARADNRQGLPLGGAYLRYASALMQDTMLPLAQSLVDAESGRLDADHGDASSFPVAALLLGLVALGALVRYQVVLFRRTNRVFNTGLLTATSAVLLAVVWLTAASASAGAALATSRRDGSQPLRELDHVRIAALQAHAAENLNLVARGSTDTYTKRWSALVDPLNAPAAQAGSFGHAVAAGRPDAERPAAEAERAFADWLSRHRAAADKDSAGDYDAALRGTLSSGGNDTADAAFTTMDRKLAEAATAEQHDFEAAAGGVDGFLEVYAAAAAVLTALAVGGVLRGIGRRLAEYR